MYSPCRPSLRAFWRWGTGAMAARLNRFARF
jgi:hypothetical protein